MPTITVANKGQLFSAMAKAKGGDTILLEGGNYGDLNLNVQSGFNYNFPSAVTLKSKDAGNPAVFSGAEVRGGSNMTLDGIKFDYNFEAGDANNVRPFTFRDCKNLSIVNSEFNGDSPPSGTGAGYGYGTALSIVGTTGTVFANNEVTGFMRGLTFNNNQDTVIRGNDVHGLRMDGMVFAEMRNVLIEGNWVHDFKAMPNSGDHCDMIQFLTAGTKTPSTDIKIRGNTLDAGDGTATQSIFMRNEVVDQGKAGTAMFYRNVVIEDNTITNGHRHGITLGEAAGVTIRNNSVLHTDGGQDDGADSGVEIPYINVSSRSTGVTIAQNVAAAITGPNGQSGWSVRDNVLVQDQNPFNANYYGDVFVDSSLDDEGGRHWFEANPGGVIDKLNAGSTATQKAGPGLVALFNVEVPDRATRVFDATASRLDDGAVPSGATYAWTFGDGTKATGQRVSHSYAQAGDQEVTLTIRLPDGRTSRADLQAAVESPQVVSLAGDGRFVAYENGAELDLGKSAKASDDGLQLGAKGVAASVDRRHVIDVVGSDDMAIAFSLSADRAGASGELFRLNGSFIASVTSAGELSFRLFPQNAAEVRLTTSGAALNKGAERDVVVRLGDDELQVWVDGKLVGERPTDGVVGGASGYGTHSLVFGNPWGGGNFQGDLTAFEISVGDEDFPSAPRTQVLKASGTAATMQVTEALEDDLLAIQAADDGDARWEFTPNAADAA